MSNSFLQTADRLLQHYLVKALHASDVPVDPDVHAEISDIVPSLVDGIKGEIYSDLEKIEQRLAALEKAAGIPRHMTTDRGMERYISHDYGPAGAPALGRCRCALVAVEEDPEPDAGKASLASSPVANIDPQPSVHVCSCNDGFGDPDPDCPTCGGKGLFHGVVLSP